MPHYNYHPKGSQLPALEQNILKYRALEMVIILFQIENLKSFVLGSIQATASFRPELRIPAGTKKVYQKAWGLLVTDGIISQSDSDEIQRLIDYRNDIAHKVHHLTCDLSRDLFAVEYSKINKLQYDYGALKKLRSFREKINAGMISRGYAFVITGDELLFGAAEKTYQKELRRLEKKIVRQIAARREDIRRIKAELSQHQELSATLETFHPRNVARNGTLTRRGIEVCYSLFDRNVSTLAVAHLMHISYRAALDRRRSWERAGGLKRPEAQVP